MTVKTRLEHYIISTDEDTVKVGDSVTLLKTDLDVEFDNIRAEFEPNLFYYYEVDLEFEYDDELEFSDGETGCPLTFKTLIYKITKIYRKTY